jgi:DNA repair protein RecN (Recombination protein N)
MLTELRVENFAIIHHLELHFGAGLTTFTGETGAGKSIILDALDALMGGKVDATAVRAGAERAVLEGVFHIPAESKAEILAILEREELVDDPDLLTLGREVRREGRSVGRVNGRSVSLSLLRELGAYLVDIHGQSEHLSLLNVHQHIRLLDRYANSGAELAAYQETYRKLHALRHELHELRQTEADSARRAELLTFQAEEIAASSLKPGEDEELRHERDRLANAETLATLCSQSLALLEDGEGEAPSISDLAGQLAQALAQLTRSKPL